MGSVVLSHRDAEQYALNCLPGQGLRGSRSAFHPATHDMTSRHHAAELAEGTYVQQWTTKSSVNRDWHKGEYKALEKDIRLHKGTSAQQESVGKLLWLLWRTQLLWGRRHVTPLRQKGRSSLAINPHLDSLGLSSPYCSYQTTSVFPKLILLSLISFCLE